MDHGKIIIFDPNRCTQRPAAKSSCTHSDVDYSADNSICCENVDLYEAVSLARTRALGRGRSLLVHLIVRAGLAASAHEARHMFIDGKICFTEKGRDFRLQEPGRGRNIGNHGTPIKPWTWSAWGSSGDVSLDDDAQVILRSECVECCTKPQKSEERRAATNGDTDAMSNFEPITEILIRRGLAASLEQAVAMVLAGKVLTRQRDYTQVGPGPLRLQPTVVTDPKKTYRFNEPIAIVGETAKFGSGKRARISRREFERRAAYRPPTLKLALTPEDDL